MLESRCLPELPPGLITKITIAAMIAAARTDSNTIPPVRELRGTSGAGGSAGASGGGTVPGPVPDSAWASSRGRGVGGGVAGRSGIDGTGLVASGPSSARTTRAHARCSGEPTSASRMGGPPAGDG